MMMATLLLLLLLLLPWKQGAKMEQACSPSVWISKAEAEGSGG